jgi:UDP-N-acetyl-2-amino-2-deoxyglucuronate dehydrogenase
VSEQVEAAAARARKLRMALVGCGRISASHFDSLQALSDRVELVDVCDIDRTALDKAVQRTGARGHDSIESLLAHSSAEVVALATPSGLHPAQAMLVAKSGRHVVTEKPMATNMADARAMIAACEEAKVRLFVVKQNRLNATIQRLRAAIDRGRFGRIYAVSCNVFWTRPQNYYDAAAWRGTWALDGGAFMNQASHYVDLLVWLFGPIERLSAYTATQARRIEAEDGGVVAIRWRNGAMGTMNVSMLTYPENLEGSITVLGERGTARVGGMALNELQVWKFADAEEGDADAASASSYKIASVYGKGHLPYYQNVVDVLTTGAKPISDGREGLRSLEALVAIYESARANGQAVSFPLQGWM